MHAFPSLANFGTHRESLHPELWDGCVHAYCPSLGITGLRLFDFTNTDQRWGTFSNLSEDSWSLQAGRPQLDLTFLGATSVNLGTFAPRVYDAASVSAWVYRNEDRGDVRIFSAGSSLYLSMFGTSGRLRGGFGSAIATDPSSTVTLNRWHHVVFTYGNGIPRVWINGELRQTGTTTVATISSTALAHRIGSNSAGSGLYWPGSLDDVRVYNRELTHGEIETLTSFRGVSYVRGRNRRIVWSAELNVASTTTISAPAITSAATAVAPSVSSSANLPASVISAAATTVAPSVLSPAKLTASVVSAAVTVSTPVLSVAGAVQTITAPTIAAVAGHKIAAWSDATADQLVWQDGSGVIWAGIGGVDIVYAQTAAVGKATPKGLAYPPLTPLAPAVPTIVSSSSATSPSTATKVTVAVPIVASAATASAPGVLSPGRVVPPVITCAAAVTVPTVTVSGRTLTAPVLTAPAVATAPPVTSGAILLAAPSVAGSSSTTAPGVVVGIKILAVPVLAATSAVSVLAVVAGPVSRSVPVLAATSSVSPPGNGTAINLVSGLASGSATSSPPGISVGVSSLVVPVIARTAAATAPAIVAGGVTLAAPTLSPIASVAAPGASTAAVTVSVPTILGTSSIVGVGIGGQQVLAVPVIARAAASTAPGVVAGGVTLVSPAVTASSTGSGPAIGGGLSRVVPTLSGTVSATGVDVLPGVARIVSAIVQATANSSAPGVAQGAGLIRTEVPIAYASAKAATLLAAGLPTADLTAECQTFSMTVQIKRSDYGSGGISL